MSAQMERSEEETLAREDIQAKFAEEGLSPHGYHKVLYCVSGSIVFHTNEGDFPLEPGDRLDVEPGTEHAATVGPGGVQCMEAAK